MIFHKECLAKAQLCEMANEIEKWDNINSSIELKPNENKQKETCTQPQIFKVIKPNEKSGLKLNVNEFVYVIEQSTSNADTCEGFKLRFNNSNSRNASSDHFLKETGLISRSCLGKFDELKDLNYYSWYFDGDKPMACLIMDKLHSNESTLFMVRVSHSNYVITFKLKNQSVKHINVEINVNTFFESVNGEIYFLKSNKNDKSSSSSSVTSNDSFYSIDKRRYFKSIVHLVEFFMNNSLSDCYKDIDCLEKSYRDALPNPNSVSVAIRDYESLFFLFVCLLYI